MSPQVDAMALSIAAEAMTPNPLGAFAQLKLRLFGSGAAAAASSQAATAATAVGIGAGAKAAMAAAVAKATAAGTFVAGHGHLGLQPDAEAVLKLRDIQRATLEGITRDMQRNLPVSLKHNRIQFARCAPSLDARTSLRLSLQAQLSIPFISHTAFGLFSGGARRARARGH
jgi:hypothetical protein